MYHKVFIDKKEIVLVDTPLEGYLEIPKFLNMGKFYSFLEEEVTVKNHEKLVVVDVDGAFWESFKNHHKIIEAAGGLVINALGELLVIHRLGVWDLPKGKLEKDETPQEGALREVEEECGISNLKIRAQLPDTFHTYPLKGKMILKRTFWFEMVYEGAEKLVPQTEEDILDVKFMADAEVQNVAIKNTYQSLLPLFNAYLMRNE